MLAPIARIAIRYISGALVATSLISPALGEMLVSDPDVAAAAQAALGVAAGVVTELAYWAATKFGWST